MLSSFLNKTLIERVNTLQLLFLHCILYDYALSPITYITIVYSLHIYMNGWVNSQTFPFIVFIGSLRTQNTLQFL